MKKILIVGGGEMSEYISDSNNTNDVRSSRVEDLRGFPKDGISLSGEVTLTICGPDKFSGYLGIDSVSGESQTVSLVKKEIAKSFNINKGRFVK